VLVILTREVASRSISFATDKIETLVYKQDMLMTNFAFSKEYSRDDKM
jgi:hypothetical protein